MKKSLLSLLAALLIAFGAIPGIAPAADAGDYVAVRVPDVAQAVAFFRDAMNCSVIGAGPSAPAGGQPTLMTCGRETTVEISHAAASSAAKAAHVSASRPLTLDIDDPTGMMAWLHARHMRAVGPAVRLSGGADAGKMAVTFLTPWGQPLELISRTRMDEPLPARSLPSQVAVK